MRERGAEQTDEEEVNEVSSALRSAKGQILGLRGWGVGGGVSEEEGGVSDGEGGVIRTNTIFSREKKNEKPQPLRCSANEAKTTS